MRKRKGFKDVTISVQKVWNTNILADKKTLLINIVNSDLYKATKKKKMDLLSGINRCSTLDECDIIASGIMMQDSPDTATRRCLKY